MDIDISKLSSEELFELARKRQQQEQADIIRASAQERITELQSKRAALTARHNEALAVTDKAIAELQAKRNKLIAEQQEALAAIDSELQSMTEKVASIATPTTPTSGAVMAASVKPPAPPRGATIATAEELLPYVREMMLGRTYISEGLLKEQLRSKNVTVNDLHKQLERLVRDGRLASKGSGNYALGRRA